MSGAISGPETLYGKVLRNHIVDEKEDGTILLYIGKL
jgi:3-isopropylmalate dehydratase